MKKCALFHPHFYKSVSATEVATDPDRTWISPFFLGSDPDPVSLKDVEPNLILLTTLKLLDDVCQNICYNVQSVVAYWWIQIGSGSQNLKGLGSGTDPDLFLLDPDRFRIF